MTQINWKNVIKPSQVADITLSSKSQSTVSGRRLSKVEGYASSTKTTEKIERIKTFSDLPTDTSLDLPSVKPLKDSKKSFMARITRLFKSKDEPAPTSPTIAKNYSDISSYKGEVFVNQHNHAQVKSLIETDLSHSDNLPLSFSETNTTKTLPSQFVKDLDRMGSLKFNGKDIRPLSKVDIFKKIQKKLALNDSQTFQLLKPIHQGLLADLTMYVRNDLLPTYGIKGAYIESAGQQNYSIVHRAGNLTISVEFKIELFKKEEVSFEKILPNGKIYKTTDETKVSLGTMSIKRDFSIPLTAVKDDKIDTSRLDVIDTFTPIVPNDANISKQTVNSSDLLNVKKYKKYLKI